MPLRTRRLLATKRALLRAAVSVLVTALLVLAAAAVLATQAPPATLTVRFLDVGQGDATLIQDGAGAAAALFDGGPPEARVYRLLRAAGVRRLDLMVATHQSRDHQGGLHELLERIPTALLARELRRHQRSGTSSACSPRRTGTESAGFPRAPASISASGGSRLRSSSPAPLPPRSYTQPPRTRIRAGSPRRQLRRLRHAWLSADAESDAILPLPLRRVEALKVSHHGSEDPGLPEVLDRLPPSEWRRSRSAPATPTATRRPKRSPPSARRFRTSTAPTATGP